MAESLNATWKLLTLIEEEEIDIVIDNYKELDENEQEKKWLVGKLLTTRPFNKEAMIGTLKVTWKLSREAKIIVLEVNLFLFKFQDMKDKERVLNGAPWTFDKQLILFQAYKGELRLEEYVFQSTTFRIRVYELPLGLRNRSTDMRIGQRLGCLIIMDDTLEGEGHIETECTKPKNKEDDDTHQYGDWLRSSPQKKGVTFNKNNSTSDKAGEIFSKLRANRTEEIRVSREPKATADGPARQL
ncbi:hypothetical protein PTKIN_Ptkin15bG0075100 [Pterospermum kingtungense]